jgi:Tfp pilus assembly protein PilN
MRTTLKINLASNPFRSRRLSFVLNGFLAVVLITMVVLSLVVYTGYSGKLEEAQEAVQEAETRFRELQVEQRRLNTKITELSALYQDKIDFLNQVIRKKSFSWSAFLSDLEEMLPDYSYIVSLTPVLRGESEVEVRLRIAAPGLTHQVQFINNLYSRAYTGIKVNNESSTERGYLLSEVSFVYKRHD